MLNKLLEESQMTIYECSKKSGIPYSTLFDLVHGKKKLSHCNALTLYKLSKVFNVSMETFMEGEA